MKTSQWLLAAAAAACACGSDDTDRALPADGAGANTPPVYDGRPTLEGMVGSACTKAAQCGGGFCLDESAHPEFQGGYCTADCNPSASFGCGLRSSCVSGPIDACMKACAVAADCVDGQTCLANTCVSETSVLRFPVYTNWLRDDDRTQRIIRDRISSANLFSTISMLSGRLFFRPMGSLSSIADLEGEFAWPAFDAAGTMDLATGTTFETLASQPGAFDQVEKPKFGVRPQFEPVTPRFSEIQSHETLSLRMRSRAVSHPDHAVAIAFLMNDLRSLGLTVRRQVFTYNEGLRVSPVRSSLDTSLPTIREMPKLVNVLAVLPGSDAGLSKVIVTAHYDSSSRHSAAYDPAKDAAPGAVDNASGVAALLEVARVLSQDVPQLRRTVEFVLFDANEKGWSGTLNDGLAGSRYYAGHLGKDEQPFCALNLDGLAWDTGSASSQLWLGLDTKHLFAAQIAREAVHDQMPDETVVDTRADAFFTYSDHTSFMDRGMCASFLYSWPPGRTADTQADTSTEVDWTRLERTTRAAALVVSGWANFRQLMPLDNSK